MAGSNPQKSKWVWSGNTTITNRRQPRGTNPDLANINAFTKIGESLTITSPDIEWKQNSYINQGL